MNSDVFSHQAEMASMVAVSDEHRCAQRDVTNLELRASRPCFEL